MAKAKKQEQEIRELIAVQKKREKIVIRNDQLEIVEEEDSDKGTPATTGHGRVS